MVFRIVYSSKAEPSLSDHDLEKILQTARNTNEKLDITGMLLFSKGNFIQVLEGERNKVQSLYDKIKKDERHSDVSLLVEEADAERMFPSWRMAYLPLNTDSAKSLCGNLDVESVDHLIEVIKEPTKIIQHFFRKMMLEMTFAAKTIKH